MDVDDVAPARPDWVSDELFPFESNFFATADGHRMHYVDEGSGPAIVFVHGNPAWSFEFRHLIKGLRAEHRCIAMDHVGFGLSSRSSRREDYHPKAHSRRFAELLDHLDVHDVTLFLTDWGGPIGLDFARRRPEHIRQLAISNTWCWPVSRDPHYIGFSLMMRSPLGQLLIKRFNFFVNRVMPMATGNRAALTPEVMGHYRNALPTPKARAACAAFPGHIIGATEWLRSIWETQETFTAKPTVIFWGLKDIAFRRKELTRWTDELSDFDLHEFEDCGHFLAEEAPERMLPVLREFMAQG